MNTYLIFLIVFTILTSLIDFYTNKFYKKVWYKKSLKEIERKINEEKKAILETYTKEHSYTMFCIIVYISLCFLHFTIIKL